MKQQQDSNQPNEPQHPSSLLVHPSAASSMQKPAGPAIVDLDEVRREAITNMTRSREEEAQVQKILRNPELLQALSDADLMRRLQKCKDSPQELRRLQEDPVLGPKLRLLVDAHMVTFA